MGAAQATEWIPPLYGTDGRPVANGSWLRQGLPARLRAGAQWTIRPSRPGPAAPGCPHRLRTDRQANPAAALATSPAATRPLSRWPRPSLAAPSHSWDFPPLTDRKGGV